MEGRELENLEKKDIEKPDLLHAQYGQNYLSYQYQIDGIKKFYNRIEDIFDDKSLKEMKKVNPLLTLLQDFRSITEDFFTRLKASQDSDQVKKGEQKKETELGELGPLVEQNNKALLTYLKNVQSFFKAAKAYKFQGDMAYKNEDWQKACDQAIKFCEKQIEYLNKAVEFNVFKVEIPKSEYEKNFRYEKNGLFDKPISKEFSYEGRAKAAVKSIFGILGSTVTGSAVVAEVVFFPALIFDFAQLGGTGIQALASAFSSAATLAKEGLTRVCYASKADIKPEWVVGRMVAIETVKKDSNNNKEKEVTYKIAENNPNHKPQEKTVTIYVPHGNVEEMFTKGTNFNLTPESKGHVVFSKNINDVFLFALERSNGEWYDQKKGHRMNVPWTDEQRGVVKKTSEEKKPVKDIESAQAQKFHRF